MADVRTLVLVFGVEDEIHRHPFRRDDSLPYPKTASAAIPPACDRMISCGLGTKLLQSYLTEQRFLAPLSVFIPVIYCCAAPKLLQMLRSAIANICSARRRFNPICRGVSPPYRTTIQCFGSSIARAAAIGVLTETQASSFR